jgi:hypothetical protein
MHAVQSRDSRALQIQVVSWLLTHQCWTFPRLSTQWFQQVNVSYSGASTTDFHRFPFPELHLQVYYKNVWSKNRSLFFIIVKGFYPPYKRRNIIRSNPIIAFDWINLRISTFRRGRSDHVRYSSLHVTQQTAQFPN